jgi:hypothetical protein
VRPSSSADAAPANESFHAVVARRSSGEKTSRVTSVRVLSPSMVGVSDEGTLPTFNFPAVITAASP